MIRGAVVIRSRTPFVTESTGAPTEQYGEPRTLNVSMQPLGDTGRRSDATQHHDRAGGEASWRMWFRASDAEAAGLEWPHVSAGSRVEWRGYTYFNRHVPTVQRQSSAGEPLNYSVDLDGAG
jgi:hypothetical protein